jgi:hypothetical protein
MIAFNSYLGGKIVGGLRVGTLNYNAVDYVLSRCCLSQHCIICRMRSHLGPLSFYKNCF